MKKTLNNINFIFTALQVCSVISILAGFWNLTATWLDDKLTFQALILIELVLWCVMWMSFLRMCGRLKRESNAFTERNAKTLLLIAVCCGLIGLLFAVEMVSIQNQIGRWNLGFFASTFLFTPVIFFGVMAVALILHRLLRSAVALQQDSDLTI